MPEVWRIYPCWHISTGYHRCVLHSNCWKTGRRDNRQKWQRENDWNDRHRWGLADGDRCQQLTGIEKNSGAFTDKRLTAFAAKLGLDAGKFSDCFTSGKYATQVTKDGADGNLAGVKATPSFVINGKLLEGAQPFTAFQTEIEALLK